MSKRTDGKFERRDRDFYATPPEPVLKLIPHLQGCDVFAEPMCGDGAIVRVMEAQGWTCGAVFDMVPQGDMIARGAGVSDVLDLTAEDFAGCDTIISNPPWPAKFKKGNPTVDIVHHLAAILPTWFILSADFLHNEYAEPLLEFCPLIVSAGRVKWIAGSENTGFDNASWYLFDKKRKGPPRTIGYRKIVKQFHPDIEGVL